MSQTRSVARRRLRGLGTLNTLFSPPQDPCIPQELAYLGDSTGTITNSFLTRETKAPSDLPATNVLEKSSMLAWSHSS